MRIFTTVITAITLFFSLNIFSQALNDRKGAGVSVSPAHLHLTQIPGSTKSYKITINNDTRSVNSFRIRMKDFEMNSKGQSTFLEPGTGKYSLSKWTTVSPNFVDLAPFEKKEITVTVSVPNSDAGNKAAWEILMIEQEKPRESLKISEKRSNTIGMGVIPTFAFGVFAYQNPPTVENKNVQLINFKQEERTISIQAENKGDGIAYCSAYIDLTNLTTGTQERFPVKKFTILPELIRDFKYEIPKKYKSGKFLAIGVLDYEDAPEIQAAKLEFEMN
ncbi:hypothetical protein AXE80_02420 [Wenyingzhuangia fucanilytica]|uniref:DUF3324 domain-containing protein n=1 Tax=Wenyingzhuangia fucanilytica TaxID=1790137 RepID=A0A1B1Y385_9FLAO|nr:hypothetical protein [Wenyingzhuangia fucanilytica]ANW95207.1 hypothetical protein AXE80_02420 [Wenyingzhuangia fucanilytica]